MADRKTITDAIRRVESNTAEAWAAAADVALENCAILLPEFTADDVWAVLDRMNIFRPHINCAMGPVFVRARKNGIAAPTGRWRASSRSCNHRQIQIWSRA